MGYFDKFMSNGRSVVDEIVSNDSNKFAKKPEKTANTIQSLKKDMKSVNPTKGNTNCVGCTIALEMRRRGFDVSSLKDYSAFYKKTATYEKVFKNINVITIDNVNTRKENMAKMLSEIGKFPQGSRGMINVSFPKYNTDHAFSFEKIGDSIRIIDAQTNMDYTDKLYDTIFKHVQPGSVRLARLDNLEIDLESDVLKAMVK